MRLSGKTNHPGWRYAWGVLSVLVMLGARLAADSVLGARLPLAMFLFAVAASALRGGFGPAMLSMALGAIGGIWFFMEPRGSLAMPGADHWLSLIVYIAIGTLIAVCTETERRARVRAEAEAAARETERRRHQADLDELRGMIDASYDGILVTDRDGRITMWNTGAHEIYGFTTREAIGQELDSLLQTEGGEGATAALDTHGRWGGELKQRRKDGSEVLCESRQIVLRGKDGARRGALVINRDVTERRKALESAEEGRRTLEALLEFIPDGITIADAPDVRIRQISRYGLELTGLGPEHLVGTTAPERAPRALTYFPDGKTLVPAHEFPMTRAITRGEHSRDEEYLLKRPDGSQVTLLVNASPIRDESGKVTGALVAYRDITERKRFEENLRETAKLESLGILAGGIAHDFNNLLTGVLGNADLLAETLPPGPAAEQARSVVEAAQQAARLASQMLAYSGRGRFLVEPMDLSDTIRRTAALIGASIAKGVELKLELASGLPAIEADAAQMQQVVMNLVINGAEAIGASSGMVRVATSARDGQVVLEVTDNGSGMDARTVARIFDPFFTTKFTGRGLGLAAVQGIVRGHKGSISVKSEPGRGTTFTVMLPASTRPVAAASHPTPAGVKLEGLVLIADDEGVVRLTARRMLERRGMTVLEAADGEETVQLLREANGRVSLVLLDMTMPGWSCEQTLGAIRAIHPTVPVLLSSGFTETEALGRMNGHRLAGFLQKPYSADTLARKTAEALSS